MYTLNQEIHVTGFGEMRKCVFSHNDINEVKKKLCEIVQKDRVKVKELTITKEIPFEFKCAVSLCTEEEV
jgi:REP element-mobilizing transposase RayT